MARHDSILLSICFMIISLFIFSPKAHAATEVGGVLMSSETWTVANSPYVILNQPTDDTHPGVSLASGVALTIEPGVVVKFAGNTSLSSGQGHLSAVGTADRPIIFTALTDDTAGGDTNGDGSATFPGIIFWQSIYLGSAQDVIEHAQVRYGLYGVSLETTGAKFSNNLVERCQAAVYPKPAFQGIIEGNTLRHNIYGIYFSFGHDLIIRRNQITDNLRSDGVGYGIYAGWTSNDLTIENNEISRNGLGIYIDYLVRNDNIHNNNFDHNRHYGLLYGHPSPNDVPEEKVQAQNNYWGHSSGPPHATRNPGGQGDKISDGVIFWPWLTQPVTIEPQQTIDPVIIIPGILGSEYKNGKLVIDPIMHTYDDLIATLKANGYIAEENLFTFPYNWRNSNVQTASFLEQKINQVQEICQCDKVDIVAHSMGGLVARQYIQSGSYGNDVDQLIFLGTPHLGAPESYLSWEGGQVAPGSFSSLLLFMLSREAKRSGYPNLYEYIRNKPIHSIEELLPVYDYLKDKSTGIVRIYSNGYPVNIFLENLRNSETNLTGSGVNITNIIGKLDGSSTISSLRLVPSPSVPLWEHGYPEGFLEKIGDRGLEFGKGDGTVPINSADEINTDLNVFNSDHSSLVTDAESLIFYKLTGKEPKILINKFNVPNLKLLIIKMLSPADLQVIAPNGERIGKDFATGDEINEIDDAFYSGFLTDDEFITIPNPLDGDYQILTQGTDNGGDYTVSVAYIDEDTFVEKDLHAQTQPGLVEELNLTVDNAYPENLEVIPEDTLPPTIEILSPQNQDYLRSQTLPINVEINDSGVGVFSSEIRLDGIIINNGETIDLFSHKLGERILSVSATDFVNNGSIAETKFRIVATIDSTISDVERAYQSGWIYDSKIRDGLIKTLLLARKSAKTRNLFLQAFLIQIEILNGKMISIQAYQLLKEDGEWLLNN